MQTIDRSADHLRVVNGQIVIPDRHLDTGRIPAPDLEAVDSRQGLLDREEDAQPGVARCDTRRTQ